MFIKMDDKEKSIIICVNVIRDVTSRTTTPIFILNVVYIYCK